MFHLKSLARKELNVCASGATLATIPALPQEAHDAYTIIYSN